MPDKSATPFGVQPGAGLNSNLEGGGQVSVTQLQLRVFEEQTHLLLGYCPKPGQSVLLPKKQILSMEQMVPLSSSSGRWSHVTGSNARKASESAVTIAKLNAKESAMVRLHVLDVSMMVELLLLSVKLVLRE